MWSWGWGPNEIGALSLKRRPQRACHGCSCSLFSFLPSPPPVPQIGFPSLSPSHCHLRTWWEGGHLTRQALARSRPCLHPDLRLASRTEKMNVCCLSHPQSVVLCYSSLSWLRQDVIITSDIWHSNQPALLETVYSPTHQKETTDIANSGITYS